MIYRNKILQVTMIMLAIFGLSINGFSQVNLQDGLIVYYPFDIDENDNSGNNLNGVLVNGATVNNNLIISGDSKEHIIIPSSSINGINNFTFSCWAMVNNFNTGSYPTNMIASGYGSGIDNRFNFALYDASIEVTLNHDYQGASYDIVEGEWYFISITRNGSTASVYVNNIFIDSFTINGDPIYVDDNAFVLGNDQDCSGGCFMNNQSLNGELDEVRIYDRVLTSDEISALYTGFSIQTDASYGQLNNSVKIPVTATSELKTDDNIYSYQFVYNFDETKLSYTGYDLTGLISDGGIVDINSSVAGELTISWASDTQLVGTGDLINLQFDAIAAGTSDLTVSNFKYNETDVTDVTNGDITIVTPTTADITYSTTDIFPGTDLVITATFNRPVDDSPVTQISLSGENTLSTTNMTKVSSTVYTYNHSVLAGEGIVNISLSTGVDEYGFEVQSTPATGATFEILALTYGDISYNDEITAYDAALALMYSVGKDPMPTEAPLPWDLKRILTANVDGVGDVTATDAGLILKHSVNLISEFPVESTNKSGQDFEGDVTVEVIGNEFVFTTVGELVGLNLFVKNNSQITLGDPEILDNTMLSATNISTSTYNVGLCVATAPASGTQIMKIPFKGELTDELTFDIKVNNKDKLVTFGTTGINEPNTKGISIYPNPVTDKIMITSSVSLENSTLEIFTISGKLIKSTSLNNSNEINVNNLSKGVYLIKINSKTVNFVDRIIKK